MIKLFTKSGVQVDMLGYIVSHPGIGSYYISALCKQVMNHEALSNADSSSII